MTTDRTGKHRGRPSTLSTPATAAVLRRPLAGARLARHLRDRLPDWPWQPSGADTVDMDDPTGTWHLHIGGDGRVDLDRHGEPAGTLHRPDAGALAAYLDIVLRRAVAGR
jgi:hypothetical protein